MDQATRTELISIIELLLSGGSCMRLDGMLAKLHKHLPDPKLEEYIFNPTENLTAAQIVDKAERYVG
ncbi:MAG: hypothetical protein COA78_38585 [Blastopirellula sp.]|nr:MAG: hypothetical protein COA78_38585 [Blastopirellula sp.]